MGAFCAWERSCFQLQLLVKGSCLPRVVGSVLSLQDPAGVTVGQLHFPARSTGADGLTSHGEFLLTLAINYGYCASILECKPIKIIIFRWALGHITFVVRADCAPRSISEHLMVPAPAPSPLRPPLGGSQGTSHGSIVDQAVSPPVAPHTLIILEALGVCSCR